MSDQPIENCASVAEVTELKAQLAALTERVADLTRAHRTLDSSVSECVEAFAEAQTDTYERLKKVELTLFPNLCRDLGAVQRIIGSTDEGSNDGLDRRKGS